MTALIGKKSNINLLPQENFETTTVGRVLKWITGSFRIIVIATEFVVMVAFLSRFWLDAQVSDLNDELELKRDIVISYDKIERNFRIAQKQLELYSESKNTAIDTQTVTNLVSSRLPENTVISSLKMQRNTFTAEIQTDSELSISQLMVNLDQVDQIAKLRLNSVEDNLENNFITFEISGEI